MLAAVAVLSAGIGTASPASAGPAASPVSGPTSGWDVSFPQAPDRPLPVAPAFAVGGVNGGVATTTNPSLAPQLVWAATAAGAGHPRIEVYVNTANPRPEDATWWPTGDATRSGAAAIGPHGHCAGGATRACSWVYGSSLAADDLDARGVPAGAASRWWLDVEAVNSWSASTLRNRAVLEGMAGRIVAAGQHAGLYALPHEFHDLIGAVPADSALAALPSWLAGAADEDDARATCTDEPLTGGRVQLVQWRGADAIGPIDQDLACAAFTSAPKPRVTGRSLVGSRLVAEPGIWRPGPVRTRVRWTRDGAPIASAVHRGYRVVKRDSGHVIRAVVTGTRAGWSRAIRTSRPIRAHR